jgi:hypothetical protein
LPSFFDLAVTVPVSVCGRDDSTSIATLVGVPLEVSRHGGAGARAR